MTTAVKIDAHAGWPVRVTAIQNGHATHKIVPPHEVDTMYVHSGCDLYIHECQPGETERPGMCFGNALAMLKAGAKVARTGWNGKGMWIALSWPGGAKTIEADKFWSPHTRQFAEENGGSAKAQPYIIMKTAAGELQSGWLASQSDMLAEDWQIVG